MMIQLKKKRKFLAVFLAIALVFSYMRILHNSKIKFFETAK